jgi:hypothetical protein
MHLRHASVNGVEVSGLVGSSDAATSDAGITLSGGVIDGYLRACESRRLNHAFELELGLPADRRRAPQAEDESLRDLRPQDPPQRRRAARATARLAVVARISCERIASRSPPMTSSPSKRSGCVASPCSASSPSAAAGLGTSPAPASQTRRGCRSRRATYSCSSTTATGRFGPDPPLRREVPVRARRPPRER